MEYFKRLRVLAIFLGIWLAVPYALVQWTGETGFYVTGVFTWIPGIIITGYLENMDF